MKHWLDFVSRRIRLFLTFLQLSGHVSFADFHLIVPTLPQSSVLWLVVSLNSLSFHLSTNINQMFVSSLYLLPERQSSLKCPTPILASPPRLPNSDGTFTPQWPWRPLTAPPVTDHIQVINKTQPPWPLLSLVQANDSFLLGRVSCVCPQKHSVFLIYQPMSFARNVNQILTPAWNSPVASHPR